MKSFKTAKGTEIPLDDVKGKDYLLVSWRVFWMREEHPAWTIKTSIDVGHDKTDCIATAMIYNETDRLIATAHKYEDKKGFPDFIEKSETGAIGRALALCGYGTQFAPELSEETRLADAPIQKSGAPPQFNESEEMPNFDDAPKDETMSGGKHDGKKFSTLLSNEKNYINWIKEEMTKNLNKLTPQQKRLHNYAKTHGAT